MRHGRRAAGRHMLVAKAFDEETIYRAAAFRARRRLDQLDGVKGGGGGLRLGLARLQPTRPSRRVPSRGGPATPSRRAAEEMIAGAALGQQIEKLVGLGNPHAPKMSAPRARNASGKRPTVGPTTVTLAVGRAKDNRSSSVALTRVEPVISRTSACGTTAGAVRPGGKTAFRRASTSPGPAPAPDRAARGASVL